MKFKLVFFMIAALLAAIPQIFGAPVQRKPIPPKDPYIGAIVIDADSGQVLFEDNADAAVHPASVVKLMDMLIIMEKIEQGSLKTNDIVCVTPEAARMGGSQAYLDPRESFTVDAMLYALMVKSANDVAVALAMHIAGTQEAFVEMMNIRARELGLNSTVYHTVNGLPPGRNDRKKGKLPDVTTPRDMTVLARELLKHPDVLRYTSTKRAEFRDGKLDMSNHNHLLDTFEGCDGLKTGWTTDAGYSIVATAKRNGRRLIAAVMGSKAPKGRVRDRKTAELMSVAFVKLPPLPQASTNAVQVVKEEPPAKMSGGWSRIAWIAGIAIAVAMVVSFLVRRHTRREYR